VRPPRGRRPIFCHGVLTFAGPILGYLDGESESLSCAVGVSSLSPAALRQAPHCAANPSWRHRGGPFMMPLTNHIHSFPSGGTEVPSLHRHYPASPILRTSPPPQGARPLPHGFRLVLADHALGLPVFRTLSLCYMPCVHAVATTPAQRLGVLRGRKDKGPLAAL
jgi:hypothetical protein